jgi:hypothetical protein
MGVSMDVKTYKKTATIDAVQWDGTEVKSDDIEYWAAEYGVVIEKEWSEDGFSFKLAIPTLEGRMYATLGDWIAKGINDEFWPIKPDIMGKTYQEV